MNKNESSLNAEPCCDQSIQQFLEGRMTSVQVTEFESHLDSCPRCDEELTRRTADVSFWDDAKQFLSDFDHPSSRRDTDGVACETAPEISASEPPAEKEEWAKLSFLDPTDDPRMLGRFGGYEISGVVGSGGMGIVMKGLDVSLDRFVAIKVLHPSYASQSAARKRFAREAQAAAAVVHDNVIAIYGVDSWNDVPFLVMPYVKGESLQQRIHRAAPLSIEDILGISLQIARGLAAAHDQGLVHRDIKPANILMPQSVSRVIITDFGLARTADDASLTRSGVLAGTPQYMSPEQAKGEKVDGRTDLFSLGSVMYAMACGHTPFRADTPYGVLRKITDEKHRSLQEVREDVPVWFSKIIDRLLEKKPENRFQSATDLAGHLEDCLAHLRQPTTTLLPTLQRPRNRSHSVGWRLFATFSAITLAVVAFWIIDLGSRTTDFNDKENPSELPPAVISDPGSRENDVYLDASAKNESDVSDAPGTLPPPTWQFDDSLLNRLETDLNHLLLETTPLSNTLTPSE